MANQQAAAKPQVVPRPNRMPLTQIVSGKQKQPDRILLYGVEGVGKSTWAASAPKPIYLAAEDGTAALNVSRFPVASWQDVLDAITTLTIEKHDFQSVVIDTIDAIEPLCWQFVCEKGKQKSIEDFGYGKGYTAALDEWRVFIAALEKLRRERGLEVILIGHSMIRTFKNPEGEDYDRYELKLNAKAGGLLKEWCDSVLFARYQTFTNLDAKAGRTKGVSNGARIVHTQRTAAFDAKNRYSLPDGLPLSYADYRAAVEAPEKLRLLRESIEANVSVVVDETLRKKIVDFLSSEESKDAEQLAAAEQRLNVILADQKKGDE